MADIAYPVGQRRSSFEERELALALERSGLGPAPAARPLLTRAQLIRRSLVLSDAVALAAAGAIVVLAFGVGSEPAMLGLLVFLLTVPVWIAGAALYGLYARDHVRADHSTVDEVATILSLTSLGSLLIAAASWLLGVHRVHLSRVLIFWLVATLLVVLGRALTRRLVRGRVEYLQNAVIVGAGTIGQLVARKVLNHPEYRINLVGLVDDTPVERRDDLEHLALIGDVERLPELVDLLSVERVIFAFSNESEQRMVELIRRLRDRDVQIDIVPRLFEVVGPAVGIHTVEGLPLVGLPSIQPSRSALLAKRCLDFLIASVLLVLTLPLFAFIALRIRLDSPGPILFRQTRLGRGERPFTMLKFRTMHVGTPHDEHLEYVTASMADPARSTQNGLFKPDHAASVTPFGRWLRNTSLDELPQLWNVIRGEMSLVGPRPCIPYETELFEPHHFDRFLVPAGLTGLWQVSARAKSSFSEALDFDAEYARGWSFALDLQLLLRTPVHLVRPGATR